MATYVVRQVGFATDEDIEDKTSEIKTRVESVESKTSSISKPTSNITQFTGDVGIGVSQPLAKLDVNGLLRVRGSLAMDTPNQVGYLYREGSKYVTVKDPPVYDDTLIANRVSSVEDKIAPMTTDDGKIGIGLTNRTGFIPAAHVHINSQPTSQPVTIENCATLQLSTFPAGGGTQGYLGKIVFGGGDLNPGTTDDTNYNGAWIAARGTADYGPESSPTELQFWTTRLNSLEAEKRMVIKSSGEVGIGIDSPAFKFDVNGPVRISGELTLNTPSTQGYLYRESDGKVNAKPTPDFSVPNDILVLGPNPPPADDTRPDTERILVDGSVRVKNYIFTEYLKASINVNTNYLTVNGHISLGDPMQRTGFLYRDSSGLLFPQDIPEPVPPTSVPTLEIRNSQALGTKRFIHTFVYQSQAGVSSNSTVVLFSGKTTGTSENVYYGDDIISISATHKDVTLTHTKAIPANNVSVYLDNYDNETFVEVKNISENAGNIQVMIQVRRNYAQQ